MLWNQVTKMLEQLGIPTIYKCCNGIHIVTIHKYQEKNSFMPFEMAEQMSD